MAVWMFHLDKRELTMATLEARLGWAGFGWELHSHSWYWKEHFRMEKRTFVRLVELVAPEMERRTARRRGGICIPRRVAIALWRLAGSESYREIAAHFRVGKSTCVSITKEFCQALNRLSSRLIKFPASVLQTARAIALFQEVCSIPQAVGALDGTNIEITTPENPADYFDRHHRYSVAMQAVVGRNLVFLDTAIGYPGARRDSEVLEATELYKKAESRTVLCDHVVEVNGAEIRPLLLGHHAYPLLPWLITPFESDAALTPTSQRRFNDKHALGSHVAKRAFAVLKGRWRILLKRLDSRFANAPEVILSCCILHNICQEAGDEFHDEELIQRILSVERQCSQSYEPLDNAQRNEKAEEVRRILASI